MRHLFGPICFLLLVLAVDAGAQKKSARVSGSVLDENERPIAGVSVVILGRQSGQITNDSGKFSIVAPAEKAFALVFTHAGYQSDQRNFYLSADEEEVVVLRLKKGSATLEEVVVTAQNDRTEAGLIRINPRNALVIPSATGGIESLIKIFVGSNNELTSQYSVRGGNYDENLIYVNDFEVFRPYLVRSGQQEGLSFINPELTGRVSFYNGGFQSHYGDKMSSVLDIQYKKPKAFGGSAYLSLLEQGFHVEGLSADKRFSYVLGARNRTNRNLLSSQPVNGSYIPSSADAQALLTYQVSKSWQLEAFGSYARTRFDFKPETAEITSSVFSPVFSANLGIDIFFEGNESDRYAVNMVGFAATQQVNRNLRLKWMASRFEDDEREDYDITGYYLFGERDFDRSRASFGEIVNPLGAGSYQNFARNELQIVNLNLSHKGQLDKGKHLLQWGLSYDNTKIDDLLREWERQDSAGYTLPYRPGSLAFTRSVRSTADLDIHKLSGFLQDNILFHDSASFTVQAGIRFNYNSLNNELILTPRVQGSWKPVWQKDIVLRAALGAYYQPPFYRELRRYDGTLNTALLAQRSWQVMAGMDYQFQAWGRPFRFTSEAYYKHMWRVVPYDIDNVRIRYYGENNAKAYAAGLEMRLAGEWVKDAESWISLGIMRTRENIEGDFYYDYYNKDGELINSETEDQVITDSVQRDVGWLRRPTDRLITFGMFFQDYLSTNKNFKVHLNLLFGTNMPYNIPNSVKYRNALIIEPYLRADIGFSALLLDANKSSRRSHSPFRAFENIWASLEIFNLLDRRNVISFLLIKDFSNSVYALPNRLTPRLINLKLLARF